MSTEEKKLSNIESVIWNGNEYVFGYNTHQEFWGTKLRNQQIRDRLLTDLNSLNNGQDNYIVKAVRYKSEVARGEDPQLQLRIWAKTGTKHRQSLSALRTVIARHDLLIQSLEEKKREERKKPPASSVEQLTALTPKSSVPSRTQTLNSTGLRDIQSPISLESDNTPPPQTITPESPVLLDESGEVDHESQVAGELEQEIRFAGWHLGEDIWEVAKIISPHNFSLPQTPPDVALSQPHIPQTNWADLDVDSDAVVDNGIKMSDDMENYSMIKTKGR